MSRPKKPKLPSFENAVKFTPEKGKVSLAVECEDDVVKVIIADTGIGIPKEEQEKIFDRFYRVDKARSRELGGSGLGLSIAKWIVELHHGRIEVESEVALAVYRDQSAIAIERRKLFVNDDTHRFLK